MSYLNNLIDAVLSEGQYSEPAEIARVVLDRSSLELIAPELPALLTVYVRTHLSQRRFLPAVTMDEAAGARATAPRPSHKVAAVRDWWQRWLETPVKVPHVGYKRHADMTADDCRAVAMSLMEQSKERAAKAARYERLAEVIPDGGTMGQLQSAPEGVLS